MAINYSRLRIAIDMMRDCSAGSIYVATDRSCANLYRRATI